MAYLKSSRVREREREGMDCCCKSTCDISHVTYTRVRFSRLPPEAPTA